MSDQNDKLRARNKGFERWHKRRRHLDREAARLAWDAGFDEAAYGTSATPAPQAAPSDVHELDAAMSLLRVARTLDPAKIAPAKLRDQVRESAMLASGANGKGEEYIYADVYSQLSEMIAPYVGSGELTLAHPFPASVVGTVEMLLEHYFAAAPAVAITQAATSEPVAYRWRMPASLCNQWEYGDEPAWFSDRAGYELQKLYAAPVAHLAGTTPNTEASEDLESLLLAALNSCQKWQYEDCDGDLATGRRYDDELVARAIAALSAQQAGVQEAPSEDAKDTRNYALKFARLTLAFNPPSEVQRKSAIHVIDAALAAATQTEKP